MTSLREKTTAVPSATDGHELHGARTFACVTAWCVAAIGVMGIVGWSFNIGVLFSVAPGVTILKANTAVALMLTGLSILLLTPKPTSRPRLCIGRATALTLMALGCVTLLEYSLRRDFGIDQLLFVDGSTPIALLPGRMAPLTAVSFVLLGVSLLLQDSAHQRRRLAAQILAIASAGIGIVGMVGYLYSAVSFDKLESFTSMALQTTFGITLAGLSLLFARPREGIMRLALSGGPGGALARQLLPVGVIAPLFLGCVALAGERAGYYRADVGVGMLVILLLAILMAAILSTARAIDHGDRARRAAEERTRELAEQRLVERALFAEKERAQVTLGSMGDAVVSADNQGRITYLNPVAEQMTGWSLQEMVGRPMAEALRIVDAIHSPHAADPKHGENGAHSSQHDGRSSGHHLLLRRNGSEISIEESTSPIYDRDGERTGAVTVFRDVSASLAMTRKMTYFAEHDFLTDLPNRMLLNDRITQAIALASRQSKSVAVLFLDLDGFKHINDSLGHSAGDQLLQAVSKRLQGCVRAMDTVSRQGGDEFVVLLSAMDNALDAPAAARRLLDAVAGAYTIDQHDLHITTSIGISVYPEDGTDAETLIQNADTAMYQAKANGRQSYQLFNRTMNLRAVERQFIEEGLRRAEQRGEFQLYYQPKVDLTTGRITGAEALIRWTHPTRGPIPPSLFIPIAEDCGVIHPISKWALREACRQAGDWLNSGLPAISMAVNVCASEFRDEKFLSDVFQILDETGMDPCRLQLELTEGMLMKHSAAADSALKTLRARGVQIAVDDFGTGYSSLSYLRRFPLDALKIDQSFVRQITTSPDDNVIVTAVISMARSLKLRVIAEGIETPEELAFLQAHLCDEGQGYYFSRPVPSEQFAALLAEGIAQVDFPLSPLELLG